MYSLTIVSLSSLLDCEKLSHLVTIFAFVPTCAKTLYLHLQCTYISTYTLYLHLHTYIIPLLYLSAFMNSVERGNAPTWVTRLLPPTG